MFLISHLLNRNWPTCISEFLNNSSSLEVFLMKNLFGSCLLQGCIVPHSSMCMVDGMCSACRVRLCMIARTIFCLCHADHCAPLDVDMQVSDDRMVE